MNVKPFRVRHDLAVHPPYFLKQFKRTSKIRSNFSKILLVQQEFPNFACVARSGVLIETSFLQFSTPTLPLVSQVGIATKHCHHDYDHDWRSHSLAQLKTLSDNDLTPDELPIHLE